MTKSDSVDKLEAPLAAASEVNNTSELPVRKPVDLELK